MGKPHLPKSVLKARQRKALQLNPATIAEMVIQPPEPHFPRLGHCTADSRVSIGNRGTFDAHAAAEYLRGTTLRPGEVAAYA